MSSRNRHKRVRSRQEVNEEPVFAPAFASQRKKSDEANTKHGAEPPSLSFWKQKDNIPVAPWSTYDAGSAKRNWTPRTQTSWDSPGNDQNSPWNWTATVNEEAYTTEDGSQIRPQVRAQFVSDRDLMKTSSEPRDILTARNKHWMGKHGSSHIISEIGGQEHELLREIDDRITHLDRHGNYADGVNRGIPKKRHVEEHKRRVAQRDEEMKVANAIFEEWQALSPEQQAQRRTEAEENRKALQATLEIEEVELDDMPELYGRGFDEVTREVLKWRSAKALPDFERGSTPSIYTRPLSNLHDKTKSYASTVNSKSLDQFEAQDEFVALPAIDDGDSLIFSGDNDSNLGYGDSLSQNSPQPTPPKASLARKISSCHHGKQRDPPRSYVNDSLLDKETALSNKCLTTPLQPIKHHFESYPFLIPLEQVTEAIDNLSITSTAADIETHKDECMAQPRVVSLGLTDKNVVYTSAAVLTRIFGGDIQEIQFFPTERQAIVVFLKPRGARIFVEHVSAAARVSAHEYRRLQIAAEWYHGNMANAILPADTSITQHIVANQASRTLLVGRIDQNIAKDILLAALKTHFYTFNIVRARLLRPKKRYEREMRECNSVEVEFCSIPQALEAKRQFERGLVKNLSEKPVSFVPDCTAALPAAQPWCSCPSCTRWREKAERQWSADEQRPYADTTRGMPFIANQLWIRSQGESYNPLEDLLVPDSFEYAHEDKKRPRLNSYDVPAMRKFGSVRDSWVSRATRRTR